MDEDLDWQGDGQHLIIGPATASGSGTGYPALVHRLHECFRLPAWPFKAGRGWAEREGGAVVYSNCLDVVHDDEDTAVWRRFRHNPTNRSELGGAAGLGRNRAY